MVIFVKTLGLNAVVMSLLLIPSHSLSCGRTPQMDHGCRFNQLSSNATWCEAETYNDPGFSFYVKPGRDLNGLQIRMTKTTRSTKVIGVETDYVPVKREYIPSPDKWYKIHLRSTKAGRFLQRSFSLDINDHLKLNKSLTFTDPSEFTVMINGSIFYSTQCNPEETTTPPVSITTTATPPPPPSPPANRPWRTYVIALAACVTIIGTLVIMIKISDKGQGRDEVNADNDVGNTHEQDSENLHYVQLRN